MKTLKDYIWNGNHSDNHDQEDRAQAREKQIVRTSIIGIGTNVALAGFKAAVGLLTNSIAIVLDAVNNISDAGSSLYIVRLHHNSWFPIYPSRSSFFRQAIPTYSEHIQKFAHPHQ